MDKYKETFQTWNKLASLYQDGFMDLDLYNYTYDFFLELIINKTSIILELGCGPGNISKYLLEKNQNLKITGIDISENMIELAKKNNPLANFEVLDTRNIDKLNVHFNGIIAGFVIPYLSKNDCSKLIMNFEHLLLDSGIIYLSFIEGNYENSGFKISSKGYRAYFYYHDLKFIKESLIKNNFELLNVENIKFEKKENSFETHIVVIAKKL